jgi:glutamine---fructose-6-phosphate transaminase (isomerizing)
VAESLPEKRGVRQPNIEADSVELIAQMKARDREREEIPLSRDSNDPERLRRVRLTGREIADQPRCIEETLSQERTSIEAAAHALSQRPISHAYLVGCGDSLAVMLGMRGLLERLLRISCEPIQALEYAYYYRSLDTNALVVGLSSTGWTTRVAEALLTARSAGLRTIALSNTAEAPIFSIADISLLVHAQREGWPTQSSSAAMALLAQLAIAVARKRGVPEATIGSYQRGLDEIPERIHEVIDRHSDSLAEIAVREKDSPLFLFAGGGPSFATAIIGAAKVKECTNRHANAIQIEEYHHYLSQRAGEPLFLVAPNGPSTGRAADTASVGRAVGGRMYGLVSADTDLSSAPFNSIIQLPATDELLTPLLYSVPLQIFAYRLGLLAAGVKL